MEVKRDFYGIALTLKDAGSFTNDVGELVNYDQFIKISNGKADLKVTALQLAGLFHAMLDDEEVKTELRERFRIEKEKLIDVGF